MSNRKQEYLIAVAGLDKTYALKVMGEPAIIPGFEELEVFIHRDPVYDKFFCVSDTLTGTRISTSRGSKKLAIEEAHTRLAKSAMNTIRKQQKKFIRKVGKLSKLPLKEILQ